MTELEYDIERANIEDAKRIGIIDAKQALQRLVVVQGKRSQTVIEEARLIRFNRED